ncbi:MAG: hypothetical protein AAGA56_16610 [Myxococcota bacterium]
MRCNRRLIFTRTALMLGSALLAAAPVLAQDPPKAEAPKGEGPKAEAPKAEAEVIVLHATNDGTGIDPAVGNISQLKEAPLSAYDSYKLLDRKKLALQPTGEASLPDGGKVTVRLSGIKDGRYQLKASVYRKGGKVFLPGVSVNAKKDRYFFIAGQKYQKGIMVLGIRVH